MFHEQQRFWLELVNSRNRWTDAEDFELTIPEQFRDFSDPPGWPKAKALNYLVNNVDLIQANHLALEEGRRLEMDMINNVLSEGVLRLMDWGGPEGIRSQREERSRTGGRLETLVAVSRREGLNSGTAFIRNSVERAFFYFGQYVDYRFGDEAYPDVSPEGFQVRVCLRSGCGRLFMRTLEKPLYCSDECALGDREVSL